MSTWETNRIKCLKKKKEKWTILHFNFKFHKSDKNKKNKYSACLYTPRYLGKIDVFNKHLVSADPVRAAWEHLTEHLFLGNVILNVKVPLAVLLVKEIKFEIDSHSIQPSKPEKADRTF